MKTRYLIMLVAASVCALAAWALWPAAPQQAPLSAPPPSKPATAASSPLGGVVDVPKPKIHKFKYHYPPTADEQAMLQWRDSMVAKDPFFDWKRPIKFYAIVIDQNNAPVSGASATWVTTNTHGNGRGETASDGNGRIFIDTSGKVMDVQVRKDGYRTVEANAPFEFGDFTQWDYYEGDQDHPFIFHLRKIPAPEPIYFRTGIWRDNVAGAKLAVDPVTGDQSSSPGPHGVWFQMAAEPQSVPDHEAYRIIVGTASGQGALWVTGDTDEQAPVSGYANPLDTGVQVEFDQDRFVKKKLFFKDGSGNYGSVLIDAQLGGHQLTLSYYLKYNPNGGTSLSARPHSALQINKNAY